MDILKFVATTHCVAALLEGHAETDHYNGSLRAFATITLQDGVRFYMRGITEKGESRIRIAPCYPNHTTINNDGAPLVRYTTQRNFDFGLPHSAAEFEGITILATKTPESIAKDIARRFLPAYRPLFAKCAEWVEQQRRYAEQTISTAERAARAAMGQSHFYVKSIGGEEVFLRSIGVSIETFERLCAVLKSMPKE